MYLRPGDIQRISLKLLPFSDAASASLSLGQILRLSLFQVSVGMATVMLLGTLNRVMIVELGVPTFIVALMVALPVLVAPFRVLMGHRSDTYRSAIGWKRIPYIWFGSMWQFGGLAIMPFALLVLSGDQTLGPAWAGEALAAVAFMMTGLGLHMTQTAGLALASDRADDATRPRVVALLYVMFLVGMGLSAVVIGTALRDFTPLRLVQVVQACAVATLLLNLIALWRQERVRPMSQAERAAPRPGFGATWASFARDTVITRLLVVVFLGTAAFSMQDVLLEPYGGEVLGLSVSATTLLTAAWAAGALAGFGLSARWLSQGRAPFRIAARGLLIGLLAFSAVIFAAPLNSALLFFAGAALIGAGGGIFAVATLTAAMDLSRDAAHRGLALGAWGAAQATAVGISIALGGGLKDLVTSLSGSGALGAGLSAPTTGYSFVYHTEIGLIFITLIALGPLVRTSRHSSSNPIGRVGLADFPT